jgi:hypothetical protein
LLSEIRHAYKETEKDEMARLANKRTSNDSNKINPWAVKKKKDASDEICAKVEEDLCIVLFRRQNHAHND